VAQIPIQNPNFNEADRSAPDQLCPQIPRTPSASQTPRGPIPLTNLAPGRSFPDPARPSDPVSGSVRRQIDLRPDISSHLGGGPHPIGDQPGAGIRTEGASATSTPGPTHPSATAEDRISPEIDLAPASAPRATAPHCDPDRRDQPQRTAPSVRTPTRPWRPPRGGCHLPENGIGHSEVTRQPLNLSRYPDRK
jgi:hypothetical protein